MIDIKYLVLSVALVMCCALHSFLFSKSFLSFICNKFENKIRFYRIAFNIFSLVTFIPILIFSLSLQTEPFFKWSGFLQLVRGIIILISLFLFYAGSKHYNGRIFLGLDQIKNYSNRLSLSTGGTLDISGILSVIRHPWYTASILIIWARHLDVSALIVNLILTLYLIIGTYLEEQKLIDELGDEYRLYQKNVSMLFPYKWLKSKITCRS
jgi:methanethiol S-methyltransferase